MYKFQDRSEAGQLLAGKLKVYEGHSDVVILALTRGGVPVGYELAEKLNAPLDVFLIRKLDVPGERELAMGAVGTGGVCFIKEEMVRNLRIDRTVLDSVIERERRELARREEIYRKSDQPIDLKGQTVILVDDGGATGAFMCTAVCALRMRQPARVVVAVPVASADFCRQVERDVDEIVCMEKTESFRPVELWYQDFGQFGKEEVRQLLERATRFQPVIPA